jgi:AraC family transcriptional regulator of adaptative response / DNA-3-methyladenine glycosylase II
MLPDVDLLWRAIETRDPRFAGWDRRPDLAGRAMRLIADGVVDREGVAGLARRLGYSERQVHRELVAAVGAGPLALARAQHAQTARVLLETTSLQISDVALAAGLRSPRQLNDMTKRVFGVPPRALRAHASRGMHHGEERTCGQDRGPGQNSDREAIGLRLPYRAPLDAAAVIAYLGRRAVPGVEEVLDGAYRRSLRLPNAAGVVEFVGHDEHLGARYWLDDLRDLPTAVHRSRVLFDLDADPEAVLEALGDAPLIGPLVQSSPGRRVPGHVDADEIAVRAVLGQQVSLAGAATLAGRLVLDYGEPLGHPVGAVTHLFPAAAAIAQADPERLSMPVARRRALLTLTRALATADVVIDAGADRAQARERLLELPGIGPWTADYIAMRALRDPDAFLATDLGVRRALERFGQDSRQINATRLAERWRPYRAYAMQHLWANAGPPAAARGVANP